MALKRRELLSSTIAAVFAVTTAACATTVTGALPWTASAADPPKPVTPGGWLYFTPEEAGVVEVFVDHLIPPDPKTPGARDAGVAVYIDRQLAGPYGSSAGLYMRPPFADGSPQQGAQSALTPAARYRVALAALDQHCRQRFAGKSYRDIPADQQVDLIRQMEKGSLVLANANARAFFEVILKNTQEGFFADPIYGGNRDMVGWKMIGFPGAIYDYRDWVGRHNERYPNPPVGIGGSTI